MSDQNILETYIQNSVPVNIKEFSAALIKPAVVIGSQQKIESLEAFLSNPLRIKEARKFDDLRGFIEYANKYKTESTAAFASRERIQIVFDYHAPEKAEWGTHIIEYAYRRSQRWQIWERNNNQWKSQEDFADFLDTGLNEIAEPSESAVLELVKNFRATRNAEAESQIGADGTNFSYRETVKGGAKKTDISIPEYLAVQVSPFDGLAVLNALIENETKRIPTYKFRAKLSWRMKASGEITKPDFKVQLLNFEQAIDETLESVRGAIKELTEINTYIGG